MATESRPSTDDAANDAGPSTSANANAPPPRGTRTSPRHRRRWIYALLGAPFIGVLWVPFYNYDEPRAGSVPFFYWYQFAWIAISAVLTAIVYFVTAANAPAKGDPER
jgi:hypothetical protein